MNKPTRVICDRCGGAGVAGQGEFAALGNLLEFRVVPRKFKRKDGWTPVLQREFIARLAMTGSPSLAVEAMGKCLHGVRKLLIDPGSDGFRAAWERAVEIGEGVEARRRIREQAGIQQRNANMSSGSRRGWQPPPEPEVEEERGTAARGPRAADRQMAAQGRPGTHRAAGGANCRRRFLSAPSDHPRSDLRPNDGGQGLGLL